MDQERIGDVQEQYRYIFNNITDGFWEWDIASNKTYHSLPWRRRIGFDDMDYTFEDWTSLLHPDDRDRVLNFLQSYLIKEIPKYEIEFRVKIKGDQYIWIQSRGQATWDQNGVPLSMVGVHTIIEEYKCLESDLRESQEYYVSMFENNLAVMLLVDPATGEIVDANESACKYYGYNKDTLTNIRIYHLNTACQDYIDEAMEKVISNRNEFFQFEHILANGERRHVEVYSSPIKVKERLLIFSIVHDVTERKMIEFQLNNTLKENQELLVKVLEYDRLKTEFFSNISHELKTPLNIILSATQLINTQFCQHKYCVHREKLHKYVNMSRQNSYRLLRLINNLIDITKLDTGFMKMNLRNHNIVGIVEDIVLSVASYIESKGIELIFDTDIEEKIMACDAEKIERVILNILSNAIKFTGSDGNIFVDVYDQGEIILISVKDTGIGIPEDKKDVIFDRFRQVDATLTRKREGSGIGLSLVKSIVELHEGTITVESILGEGSQFLIKLPVKTIENEEDFSNSEAAAARETNIETIHLEFSDIYL
ncbi:MAG: hypothetical protein K0R93_2324 [Anaerosolibacter sp.]|jgi:PAS domain S-box-containing protein|uniref:sensor histidine kinase n=1 Tax=Anaerosolibacter sp. TaxID=1872527 RepID=UPI002631697A|nr:ATP-binding protein [Anaerosolibacter sp.]MDF2547426.1 hypothetical protein [Anaerosolibacter sp.]